MTRYHIKLTLEIEAVVEGNSPKSVAELIGEGIGEILIGMKAGSRDGVVLMQGSIESLDEGTGKAGQGDQLQN